MLKKITILGYRTTTEEFGDATSTDGWDWTGSGDGDDRTTPLDVTTEDWEGSGDGEETTILPDFTTTSSIVTTTTKQGQIQH